MRERWHHLRVDYQLSLRVAYEPLQAFAEFNTNLSLFHGEGNQNSSVYTP